MTSKNEVIVALVAAQLEIKPPAKDMKNPHFKSKYCSLDSIYDAVRLPLAKNGLNLSHTVEMQGDRYMLRTTLYHISGGEIHNITPMFVEKLTAQGYQSANTYARRSAITSLLGLPTEEDDDGNEATAQQCLPKPLNAYQVKEINELIWDDTELLERILAGYKVSHIGSLSSDHFNLIIKTLKSRKSV